MENRASKEQTVLQIKNAKTLVEKHPKQTSKKSRPYPEKLIYCYYVATGSRYKHELFSHITRPCQLCGESS